jgi:putative Mg2+ transporter-C (MgtC) family protein
MIDYFKRLYTSFNYEDLLLIFLSIIIGLLIGAEREYKNKTAGLRTLMLVSVGSCTFTILSIRIGGLNPDRIAANIITGIGFLGAGAIFKDENKINGVTTACTIWVMAALGMSIGSGHIYLGLLATAVVLFVLLNLVALETWIDNINKISVYKITINYEPGVVDRLEKLFVDFRLKSKLLRQFKNEEKLTVNWRIAGHKKHHDELTLFLFNDPSISKIEI